MSMNEGTRVIRSPGLPDGYEPPSTAVTVSNARQPAVHALKTAQPYYDAVVAGMKTFDIRTFDRPFKVGDILVLREYVDGRYTTGAVERVISYVMDDTDYVLPGSVVLGIREATLGEAIDLTPWTGNPTCVFCRIIYGDAPGKIVREWDDAIALVPLTPVCGGHVLIIPKLHVVHAADDPKVTAATAARASEYAAMYDSFNIVTSAGRAATQSIDHLHIHVVPRAVDDKLMLPWGTVYGDDPTAPHWCRVAQELQDSLTEMQPGRSVDGGRCNAVAGDGENVCVLLPGHADASPTWPHIAPDGVLFAVSQQPQ